MMSGLLNFFGHKRGQLGHKCGSFQQIRGKSNRRFDKIHMILQPWVSSRAKKNKGFSFDLDP